MKLTYTIDINTTPEKVFYWLKDPEKAMLWQKSVSKIEILHQTPNMIGTMGREIIEENGRSVVMHAVVTDYKENQLLAMHLDGKFNVVDVEWHLDEIEERTRLTMNSNIRFKSFIRVLSILMRPIFKRRIIAQLREEFTNLKELCERGTQAIPEKL